MAPLDVDVALLLLSSDPSAAEVQSHRPSLPPADTPWDPQRLATLTLTSGSSGLPKAAANRYTAHLCSAAVVITLLDFQRVGCWLLSLPLYHVSGQGIVWRWRGAAMFRCCRRSYGDCWTDPLRRLRSAISCSAAQ